MAYKTILVALNEIENRDTLLDAVARLGRTFGAHVMGLFTVPAVQVYPTGGIDLMPQIFEGARIYFQEHAEKVRAAFESRMSREGLNFSFVQSDSASTLIADDVIQASRGVDLVVLMPPVDEAKGWIESDFAERVVMSSGRPVLLVPRGGEFKFGEAIIGWNASRESARAAFDAIPLLKYCDVARIVAVDPSSPGEVPGTELAEAFARHDIKAVTESYHTGGMEAGRAILQKGRDTGAALIVIGAYGHSRMRELILGGATREILTALDRPVLLSH